MSGTANTEAKEFADIYGLPVTCIPTALPVARRDNPDAVFRTQVGSLAGKLTCTGVYDVGGTIDIQRFGDFEPDGSESFVVIEADFVSGVFNDFFTNAVPMPGLNTAFDVRTGDLEYDVEYQTYAEKAG